MKASKAAIVVLTAAVSLTGCAVQRYPPVPLAPADTASRLEIRAFADPGLRRFVGKNLGHAVSPWPPQTWDLSTLTLAAFYFNPLLEVERARVAVSRAAIITAAERPNPSLAVHPEVPSPYLFQVDFLIPIQTAGKRKYRIATARNLSQAERFNLAETAWKVRSGVRAALVAQLYAVRQLKVLQSEEHLRSQQVKLLEQRLMVGEIPRPEVDGARIQLANTQLAVRAEEGRISETRVALAAAIGVPVAALDGVQLSWPDLTRPPSAESLTPKRIQREAILNRMDVRRSLAVYEATQSTLQLEIARQYPDIVLGPGYDYEEPHSYFSVIASAILPVFNRNQGPIAEAEARRKEAAALLVSTQARVIAQSEQALTQYQAALKEVAEAQNSLLKIQGEQEQMARRAVELGESDQLTLNGVRLQGTAAAMARLAALYQAQTALGALEDAVQRPLDPDDVVTISRLSAALNQTPKGARP